VTVIEALLVALGPLPVEATYAEPEAIKAALQSHAKDNRYSIVVDLSRDERIAYKYSKSGKYRDLCNPDIYNSKHRKNTSTTKTDCPFRVVAKRPNSYSNWKVEVQENIYNYSPVATLSALPVYRIAAILLEEKEKLKKIQSFCYTPKQILQALQQDNPEYSLVLQDIYNLLANLWIEELGSQTPVE
jgi:hypothetical protein